MTNCIFVRVLLYYYYYYYYYCNMYLAFHEESLLKTVSSGLNIAGIVFTDR